MEAVQSGLSTQYLGAYPAYFQKIASVVGRAQRNLVVVCDFPAYGSFSEPATAEDYFHAIRKRRQYANLDVTVLGPTERRQLLDTLFTTSQWEEWQKDPQKRAEVTRFAKLHGWPVDTVKTRADLLKLLNKVNDDVVRDVFRDQVNNAQYVPIYFWIADCREAVFTIANPGAGVEQGFYTSDRSIIRSLLDIRKRYGGSTTASQRFSCD